MNKQNETLNKYLAGLCDTDGCLSFGFRKQRDGDNYYLNVRFTLLVSHSYDPEGKLLNLLQAHYGVGSIQTREARVVSSSAAVWCVGKSNELERLLPHIIKHMVLRGTHWKWILETLRERAGIPLTSEEIRQLKAESKDRRKSTTWVKPKNYPSAAWLAGVVDGDGYFTDKYYPDKRYRRIVFGLQNAECDRAIVEHIQKAFGGVIHVRKGKTTKLNHYILNLGFSASSGALKFLRYVVKHSHLKKHQIEQLIHTHLQRLSEISPTG